MGQVKLLKIIPVHNEEKTILEMIRLVKAQAHKREMIKEKKC
jgi:hypothetical protein